MAIWAWIVVMNDASIKPMSVVKFVVSMFRIGGVADVKIRSRSNIFISVDNSHIDDLSSYAWARVVCLDLEAEGVMTFMNLKVRLAEHTVNWEIASGRNREEIDVEAADFYFKTRSTV